MAAPRPEGLSGLRAQWTGERPAPSQRSYAALTPPSSPPAKQSPQAAARRQPRIQRMSSERWRMASSLLLSLLIHGLLLSLTFGGQGLGLPGLGFPWQERRVEVPELRLVLVPARVTPAGPRSTRSRGQRSRHRSSRLLPVGVPRLRRRRPHHSGACPRDRPSGQAEGRGQAGTKRRGPCRPCESVYTPVSPVTQCPRRSPRRPRSTWRRPAGPSWSCLPFPRGQM